MYGVWGFILGEGITTSGCPKNPSTAGAAEDKMAQNMGGQRAGQGVVGYFRGLNEL